MWGQELTQLSQIAKGTGTPIGSMSKPLDDRMEIETTAEWQWQRGRATKAYLTKRQKILSNRPTSDSFF
jgi:hypothetical protein